MTSELSALAKLSETIGKDRRIVQGPGGNTSIKIDGIMWIKASGMWLAEACQKDIFMPLRYDKIREDIFADLSSAIESTHSSGPSGEHIRPSIETSMHACIQKPVVIHTHSISVLSHAVQASPMAAIGDKLCGLNWAVVPYAKPGQSLTEQVIDAENKDQPDIFILQNHGLVITADTVEAAQSLLEDVEARLRVEPVAGASGDAAKLLEMSRGTNYQPAKSSSVTAIACDPFRRSIACNGSLYPDHVVFLGPSCQTITRGEQIENADRVMLIVPDLGVLIRNNASASEMAMIDCLADVLEALPASAEVSYLTASQEYELMNWDAEDIRKKLNQ